MNETYRFSPLFELRLKEENYPVEDIISDIQRNGLRPERVIRQWTGFSNDEIRAGKFNEERDIVSSEINQVLSTLLNDWLKQDLETELPSIEVKQISRKVEINPRDVIRILDKYPFIFSMNGNRYSSEICLPIFPDRRLAVKDSRDYGLSPKYIAREARYQSRAPGGGPFIKEGIKESWVDMVIRRDSYGEQRIQFKTIDEFPDVGIMPNLEISSAPNNRTVEEILYAESNGQKIMEVFRWFKEVGFGKNWIYRQNEVAFANQLINLSRGNAVDFLIWNCIGFEWFEDSSGNFASCNITNNLDAAITKYFSERIVQSVNQLATIGNPRITILLPSNEAFDNRVWNYRQSEAERKNILNEAQKGLKNAFQTALVLPNVSLDVLSWVEYLQQRNTTYPPDAYSELGKLRLQASPKFIQIQEEAIQSGKKYFDQQGITGLSDEILTKRQIQYYGVYAGEGVVFEELQNRGLGIVVLNFEEMRVSQMSFLGSEGTLPIVTPITEKEMVSYYQWEARKVKERI